MGYTHLDPGRELEISSHIYFSSSQSDLSELVKLSPDALKEQEQASVDQEKAIYAEILKVSEKWVQQAMKTCELRKAQQYLTIPPTPHTANVWIDGEYDWHEISNMVYKMSWRVYENTRYDKAKKESVPVSWEISWYLTFNTPREPDYSGPGRQIAGQDRKRFTDKAAMEKYLQGRINAYAHLFTELSPPIPKGEERRFSVNGILLPGYTVEVPEKTPQEVADELLGFLEDGDTPPPPAEPEKPKHQHPSRPTHKKPQPRKQRASAPTR